LDKFTANRGISSSRLLIAASLYFFLVVLLAGYFLFEIYQLNLGWGWLFFIGAGTLALAFTPRFPILAIIIFLILAYGPNRYGSDYTAILSEVPLLALISLLGLIGYLIWMVKERKVPPLTHPLSIIMLAFIAWLALTAFTGTLNGYPLELSSFKKHHPVQYLEGLVMYFLAAQFLGNKNNSLIIALTLALTLSIRCLLKGTGIYLDGDIGALIPIVLPIAGFSILLARKWPLRTLFFSLSILLIVMLAYTNNRAGGVAIAFASLVVLWQYRKKWKPLLLIVPILILAVTLTPSSYLDRFRVIWNPEATHSTAGLDRSTIQGRLTLWQGAVEIIKKNPWMGVGPGNYQKTIGQYSKLHGRYVAHNNYLNIAADSGIIGLAIFVALFGSGLYFASKTIRTKPNPWPVIGGQMLQVSLFAYLVAGLFISRQDMVLAYLLLGWVAALDISSRNTSSKGKPDNSTTPEQARIQRVDLP
jgi:O-antigen ligase